MGWGRGGLPVTPAPASPARGTGWGGSRLLQPQPLSDPWMPRPAGSTCPAGLTLRNTGQGQNPRAALRANGRPRLNTGGDGDSTPSPAPSSLRLAPLSAKHAARRLALSRLSFRPPAPLGAPAAGSVPHLGAPATSAQALGSAGGRDPRERRVTSSRAGVHSAGSPRPRPALVGGVTPAGDLPHRAPHPEAWLRRSPPGVRHRPVPTPQSLSSPPLPLDAWPPSWSWDPGRTRARPR